MYQMNSKKLVGNTQYILLLLRINAGSVGARRCNWSTHYVSIWRDVRRYVMIDDWLKTCSIGKISINSLLYGYAHARDLGHSNFFYIALCNLSLSLQTYYMYNYQLINFLSFDVCGVR